MRPNLQPSTNFPWPFGQTRIRLAGKIPLSPLCQRGVGGIESHFLHNLEMIHIFLKGIVLAAGDSNHRSLETIQSNRRNNSAALREPTWKLPPVKRWLYTGRAGRVKPLFSTFCPGWIILPRDGSRWKGGICNPSGRKAVPFAPAAPGLCLSIFQPSSNSHGL